MDSRVLNLLNKPQPVQRTKEWFDARQGKITASSVSSLLVRDETTCKRYVELYELCDIFSYDNKSCNPYSNKQQFIIDKIKQIFKGSIATFWGQKYEPIATDVYQLKTKRKVLEFGLLCHDTIPWLAASPDGISEDGVMLEIKCPYRRKITGIPTLYYYQQVQIQLEVADLEECDFLEIEFIEIASMDEFLDDSLQEETVEYKGLFLQMETVPDEFESREYVYPPKDIINDVVALNTWANDKISEIVYNNDYSIVKKYENSIVCQSETYKKINIRTVYWKTRVVSICTIKRDREWFSNIKDFLKSEWDDVLLKKETYKHDINLLKSENEEQCLF